VPEIASRSHLEEVLPTVEAALREAGVSARELDAVAVTTRPGLIGCLLVGLTTAKSLAWYFDKPLVGVDHLAAHLYAAGMEGADPALPAVALVASGGHTALYTFRSPFDFEPIGATLDDAAGEAFDKAAALLGLPYPGGPSIDREAEGVDIEDLRKRGELFTLPKVSSGPFDFSFSGLKTALRYRLAPPGSPRREPGLDERRRLAAAFQHAAVEHLTRTTIEAAARARAASVLAGGGVACNRRLRARLAEECARQGFELRMPRPALCADNAAMVAGLGHALYTAGRVSGLDLSAVPSGNLT
jgi:N6-L-threonylcarbamoyladenine synthase